MASVSGRGESKKQSSQSSVNLLRVIELLADNREAMRLSEIASGVGMGQSSVLRYLYALQDEKYIYQDEETLKYALTLKICKLSSNLNFRLSLRSITAPFINRLATTLMAGACIVIEHEGECIYIDCIDNPKLPTLQRIGKRAPMHATGSGKVLLSSCSDAKLEEHISAKGLERFTEHTITDPAELRRELERIRERDYAEDLEECEIGLRCISCPLRDYTGGIVASMSVFGSASEMDDARMHDEVLPMLRAAADTISLRLGYGKS